MATFTVVDDRNRLWEVTDLLPKEQAEEIVATDWSTVATGLQPGQESWARGRVNWNDPQAQRYSSYINHWLPEINSALGTTFESMSGSFWIDRPGFTVDLHTDGHLSNAMHLYWTVPNDTLGTGFYRYKDPKSILYQFSSKPNSGYIMLNHLADDGSQPLLWHAMFNPVPKDTIRVSSYWLFK